MLVTENTIQQQQKTWLYPSTSPGGQYENQVDYILSAKDREALHSQQKEDWELTVAQIMSSYCKIPASPEESSENH